MSRFRALGILVLLGACAALTAAEAVHLRTDAAVPASLAGPWQRLSDAVTMQITAGESLRDMVPGAYRRDNSRITVRPGDGAGDWASALVGLRSAHLGSEAEREQGVRDLIAVDPFAVPIFAWHQADGLPWPWVGHGLTTGGLLSLCREQIPRKSVSFSSIAGGYLHGDERIPLGPGAVVAIGDLIVARPAHALLVADLGIPGFLDPADEVVLSLPEADAQVRRLPLGDVVGKGPFAVWRRDTAVLQTRATEPARKAHYLSEKMDELAKLPLHRQWLAAAGMVLICAALLRMIWRRRKR